MCWLAIIDVQVVQLPMGTEELSLKTNNPITTVVVIRVIRQIILDNLKSDWCHVKSDS